MIPRICSLPLLVCLVVLGRDAAWSQTVPLRPADEVETYYTAPYGPGGTYNLYLPQQTSMTWTEAQEMAARLVDPKGGTGKKGHLATIGSAPENMFVYERVVGKFVWIGLTDHERWGGKEAGANRQQGWSWVTGEPVTWTSWRSPEPNELEEGGEDGVAIEDNGRWADWGIGSDKQHEHRHPSMFEWDVQAKAPIPGAVVIGKILPDKWRVDLSNYTGETTGKGAWKVVGEKGLDGKSLGTIIAGLEGKVEKAAVFRMAQLNYQWPAETLRVGGWVEMTETPLYPQSAQGCGGALHVATVKLAKAATWSFCIHGDDFYAIRFPNVKWKSVTGHGGIDPLDGHTLYQGTPSGDGASIGVIDLPAGEQVVEVLLGNRSGPSMLQVLAAEGAFTLDGSTDHWRFPGYEAKGDLPHPGIDSEGWTIIRTERPPEGPRATDLPTAMKLALTDQGTTTRGVEQVNFIDSDTAGDIVFPNPANFPGDRPGNQDDFVIQATGTLVIPQDGLYHIGIHGTDYSALRIVDQAWTRIIRDTGYCAKQDRDALFASVAATNGANTQILGEISLKKGSYQIEAIQLCTVGPSVLSIFGGPAGYAPRLLSKGGAKMEPDLPGLPLVLPAAP